MDKDLKGDENYYFGIRQDIRVDPTKHETMLSNGPSLQPEHKIVSNEWSRFYQTQDKSQLHVK